MTESASRSEESPTLLAPVAAWVTGLGGWRRYGLAGALGVLAASAMPPLYLVPLLVPAFTGLVWLADAGRNRRAAFAAGWWFGLGHFVAGLYWIANALLVFPGRLGWLAPFAVLGISAVMALYPAAAALVWRMVRHSGNGVSAVGGVLVFGAAWTALEWVRSWLLTGFPWNLTGSVWAFADGMIQLASVTGVYGLSLLTVIAAAMPAVLALRPMDPSSQVKRWRPVRVAFLVLVAVWSGGVFRLAGANPETVPGVSLRLVQANIDQRLKWVAELREEHLNKFLEMSVRPGKSGSKPTHVIWPETAAPFYIANDKARLALIGKSVPPEGLILTGAPRTTPAREEEFRVWNSLHAVDDLGRVAGTYDKSHLVPFGEYVPFRRVFDFGKLTAGGTDFSSGPGVTTLDLPGLPPVSPLICYEVIFPGHVVDRRNRPAWLLNITNDGWYGRSSGPYQHLAAARLRAVEEGLPLVRAANTGISAVIDPYGRTVARLGLGQEGNLDSKLPKQIEKSTVYGRLGNWMVLILVLVVGGAGLLVPHGVPWVNMNRP